MVIYVSRSTVCGQHFLNKIRPPLSVDCLDRWHQRIERTLLSNGKDFKMVLIDNGLSKLALLRSLLFVSQQSANSQPPFVYQREIFPQRDTTRRCWRNAYLESDALG
jgi:hypothetical protein